MGEAKRRGGREYRVRKARQNNPFIMLEKSLPPLASVNFKPASSVGDYPGAGMPGVESCLLPGVRVHPADAQIANLMRDCMPLDSGRMLIVVTNENFEAYRVIRTSGLANYVAVCTGLESLGFTDGCDEMQLVWDGADLDSVFFPCASVIGAQK